MVDATACCYALPLAVDGTAVAIRRAERGNYNAASVTLNPMNSYIMTWREKTKWVEMLQTN